MADKDDKRESTVSSTSTLNLDAQEAAMFAMADPGPDLGRTHQAAASPRPDSRAGSDRNRPRDVSPFSGEPRDMTGHVGIDATKDRSVDSSVFAKPLPEDSTRSMYVGESFILRRPDRDQYNGGQQMSLNGREREELTWSGRQARRLAIRKARLSQTASASVIGDAAPPVSPMSPGLAAEQGRYSPISELSNANRNSRLSTGTRVPLTTKPPASTPAAANMDGSGEASTSTATISIGPGLNIADGSYVFSSDHGQSEPVTRLPQARVKGEQQDRSAPPSYHRTNGRLFPAWKPQASGRILDKWYTSVPPDDNRSRTRRFVDGVRVFFLGYEAKRKIDVENGFAPPIPKGKNMTLHNLHLLENREYKLRPTAIAMEDNEVKPYVAIVPRTTLWKRRSTLLAIFLLLYSFAMTVVVIVFSGRNQ